MARQASGDIDVTIHQLQDPAGLQSTLRADGLPVTVSFSGAPLSASCQPYDTSRAVLGAVVRPSSSGGNASFVIDPSALPSGTGVSIYNNPGFRVPPSSRSGHGTGSPPPAGMTGPVAFGLVTASQQCTG